MAQKTEYQDLEVKGTVKAEKFVNPNEPANYLLRADGEAQKPEELSVYEDKLLYNKGTVLPGLSVVDNMMLASRRANVYAFTNPEAISFDYSQDAGVTWLPYDVSDIDKQKFCTFGHVNIICGGPEVTVGNVAYQLRVNLFPQVNGVHVFHKLFLSFIYGGAKNRWLTVKALLKDKDDVAENYVNLIDRGVIAGDIGMVAANLGDVNMLNVYSRIVIEIGYDGISSGKGLAISSLSMFASYASPSNYLAMYDSMFFYDINKNSFFEGSVSSKEFINFDITNIEPTQTGSVTKTSTWLWQYLVQGVNWLRKNYLPASVLDTKTISDFSNLSASQVNYFVDNTLTDSIFNQKVTFPSDWKGRKICLTLTPMVFQTGWDYNLKVVFANYMKATGARLFVENDLAAMVGVSTLIKIIIDNNIIVIEAYTEG